jgi:hypothetical protein
MTTEASGANPVAPKLLARRLRDLRILGAVTLVLVVLAIVSRWLDQDSIAPAFTPARLFPELNAKLNSVASMTIETKDKAFSIARSKDGHWTLPSKNNFSANRDMLQAMLLALSETDLIEAKTARPDWHKQLNLDLPKSGGSGTIISLSDAQGSKLGEVVVGKGVEGANAGGKFAAYVRKLSENQTYVALGKLQLKTGETDWLEKRFIDLDRTRVREASIRPPKGPAYTVTRAKAEDEDFAMAAPIPAGRQLRTEKEPNGVGHALFSLSFEDVTPASALDFSNASFAGFRCFNGLVLSFAIIDKDQAYWVTVNATADEPQPATPAAGAGSTKISASIEAKSINQIAAGWAFKLSRYKGVLLTSPLEDLLKPVGGLPPGPKPEEQ